MTEKYMQCSIGIIIQTDREEDNIELYRFLMLY